MNLTNYHSHCSFCDGRAPLEEFIKAAINSGFTSYGISSHAPLPFSTRWTMESSDMPAYLEECFRLRDKYKSEIEFYIGLEIDYLNEESNPSVEYFKNLPLDYRIGSVHFVYDDKGNVIDVDCPPDKFTEIVDNHFYGDIRRIVSTYYERSNRMVELGGFDIVGHADKMQYPSSLYHPGLMDEVWYNSLVNDYFNHIAEKGYMVEINTKAYLSRDTFYPNQRYFQLLKELSIPVLVNSDAHYPEKINDGRYEALKALKEAGYTTVMELHNSQWEEVPIRL